MMIMHPRNAGEQKRSLHKQATISYRERDDDSSDQHAIESDGGTDVSWEYQLK